jgi:hypothetical protein
MTIGTNIQPRSVFRTLKFVQGKTGRKAFLLHCILRPYSLAREGGKIWKTSESIKRWAVQLGSDPRSVTKAFAELVKIRILVKSEADEDYRSGSPSLRRRDDEELPQFVPAGAEIYELWEWNPDPEIPQSAHKIQDKYERAILARRDLSDVAKGLFIILSSLHNSTHLPDARKCKTDGWFAHVLCVSERSIQAALARLRSINAIRTEARVHFGRRQANLHLVVPSTQWRANDPSTLDGMAIRRGKRAERMLPWPVDLVLTEEMRAFAVSYGLDANAEFQNWRDYCLSHDRRYADWEATWRVWIRNAERFGAGINDAFAEVLRRTMH